MFRKVSDSDTSLISVTLLTVRCCAGVFSEHAVCCLLLEVPCLIL
jgi:hypothetical protein